MSDMGIDMELAGWSDMCYLDSMGSVSGSEQPEIHWDDAVIEEQYRRFHNGS